MNRLKSNKIILRLLVFSFGSVLLLAIVTTIWIIQLDKEIRHRLDSGTFQPPLEFYSAPQTWIVGQKASPNQIKSQLIGKNYRERVSGQLLLQGDFQHLQSQECLELYPKLEQEVENNQFSCLLLNPKTENFFQLALFDESGLKKVFDQNSQSLRELRLSPEKFAQYVGDKPILRKIYPLAKIPVQCLNAVLSIEDPLFLEHQGISLRGIARAFYTNIILRRKAQGGSTITQQLIKNLLLTHEKTIKRKLNEIAMALLFELRISKDKILENYLNIIYMGQNGVFAVNGFGAAAEHYFAKDLSQLNLAECSSLAAILNSPGRYSPFRHLERLKKRQQLVLEKMIEHQFISEDERLRAQQTPLRLATQKSQTDPAPYFVDAVRNKIRDLNIDTDQGLRIFTTMNPQAQIAARRSVFNGLNNVEQWFAQLKQNALQGKPLQAVLISADPRSGEVRALIGGRDYKRYPYNRALRAHRQVGSIIKPIVYLAALEKLDENGAPYTPTTVLRDEETLHKYQGQEWTPKNYDEKYRGEVYLFEALKNSLNVPTANLGMSIGLTSIIDLARRLKINSTINPLPAMTLGAYELYPVEVIQAYLGFANLGKIQELHTIKRIENLKGEVLFAHEAKEEFVSAEENVAVLVGMMKQTLESGTGQVVRKLGFQLPAAGKTGTTSDARDAWFSGFTPDLATVVWVGYDDNSIHGLTGASGAAPIWADFMKKQSDSLPINKDFPWPASVIEFPVFEGTKLIFRQGQEVTIPRAPY